MLAACERLDPRAVWGKPFFDLKFEQQVELIAFDDVRTAEEYEREAARPVLRLG